MPPPTRALHNFFLGGRLCTDRHSFFSKSAGQTSESWLDFPAAESWRSKTFLSSLQCAASPTQSRVGRWRSHEGDYQYSSSSSLFLSLWTIKREIKQTNRFNRGNILNTSTQSTRIDRIFFDSRSRADVCRVTNKREGVCVQTAIRQCTPTVCRQRYGSVLH